MGLAQIQLIMASKLRQDKRCLLALLHVLVPPLLPACMPMLAVFVPDLFLAQVR